MLLLLNQEVPRYCTVYSLAKEVELPLHLITKVQS